MTMRFPVTRIKCRPRALAFLKVRHSCAANTRYLGFFVNTKVGSLRHLGELATTVEYTSEESPPRLSICLCGGAYLDRSW